MENNNNVVSAISDNVPIYLCENVICRLCGCTGNNSFILLEESCYLVKTIRKETSVKIRDNDVLPKTVCRGCVDKINLIQHFKSHSRKTQKVLEKMYWDQNTGKIDSLNIESICDNSKSKTDPDGDSEMVVEWLDDEFSSESVINTQNDLIENNRAITSENILLNNNNINNCKYGIMYNDINTFNNVHITVQEQNLPVNATIVSNKMLGQAPKPRVQTYSKEELKTIGTKINTETITEELLEEASEKPVIEDNTYIKLNDLERSGPILYRLLTSKNKTEENDSTLSLVFTDESIETIDKTIENNNKIFPINDNSPNKRIDRSGRIFVTNSHKYVQKVSEKKYSCMICAAKFRYPFQVELHVRKHTGELPFTCKICGKSFLTGFYLLRHEQIHSVGQFTCEVCGKNFHRSNTLKDHQRIHTDSSPAFKCESKNCGKVFFTKGYYNQHKLIHEKKKHICEVCGKLFSSHATLKHHQNWFKTHEQ